MEEKPYSTSQKTGSNDQQAAWFLSKPISSRMDLPTGTITFLFTDIEGSTPLWESHPELMEESLKLHNDILFDAIHKNGGKVFKLVGDEFQSAFRSATEALSAAIDLQTGLRDADWNELGPIKSRVGLHTGEAYLDDIGDEYAVCPAKNRVGRIRSAAHGEQILLSQETADLVQRTLPDGVTLKFLGEFRMKGLTRLEPIYQVVVPNLPEEFPPLATLTAPKNNLPRQLTSFIGRERETEEVVRLLKKQCLVTLTGVGGTGKTRLGLQAATEVLEHYPDGTWYVELAALADPTMVPKTVASTLGLVETPGKPTIDTVVDYLERRHLLLVLDNCEHLLAACTSLVDRLLHTCPKVTVLATGREILGVMGETPFLVPPLSMPGEHVDLSVESLCECDAVRLFVERSQVVSPVFELSEENAPIVGEIVRRLDGIPLAIELAAARMRLLGVEQIAQRLNDAFRLLTGGARTALPRHQALRASIDWSYNLLSESERILLRRLSVFVGSWSLSAAETVCADEPDADQPIHSEDVLDLLTELVDKSLISSISAVDGRNRFRMLETIRQYAHEKLVDENEAETLRTRHLAYYLELAENLEPKFRSREQLQTLDQVDRELDNIRLALEWGLQTDVEAELRLASALMWFWHIRFHWFEDIDWLEKGLALEHATRPVLPAGQAFSQTSRALIRAKALLSLGLHRGLENEESKMKMVFEESLEIYRQNGIKDSRYMAYVILWLGSRQEDKSISMASFSEAMDIFQKIDDHHGIAECYQVLGLLTSDRSQMKKYFLEQLRHDELIGDIEGIATALQFLAFFAHVEGNYVEARRLHLQSHDYYEQVGNTTAATLQIHNIGWKAIFYGEYQESIQCLDKALSIYHDIGHERRYLDCWLDKCWVIYLQGDYDQALKLLDVSLPLCQKSQDYTYYLALNTLYCGKIARLQGNIERALELAQKFQEIALEINPYFLSLGNIECGEIAMQMNDFDQAKVYLHEGLSHIMDNLGDWSYHEYFDSFAKLAVRKNDMLRASRLFGVLYQWCSNIENIRTPDERNQLKSELEAARNALGNDRFEQLYEEGRTMTLEQAVRYALEEDEY